MQNKPPPSGEFNYSQFISIDLDKKRENFVPPSVSGTTLDGELAEICFGSDTTYVLAFFDYGCNSCEGIWEECRYRKNEISDAKFIVILRDLKRLHRQDDLSQGAVSVVCSSNAWHDYAIVGKSYIIIIYNNTVVAESVVLNFDHLKSIYLEVKEKLRQST